MLSPLCREYQVDWLIEKIKDYIKSGSISCKTKNILRYLVYSEEMNFGLDIDTELINSFEDNFHTIQMCSEFQNLSLKMQILIARKRLWLLMRNLKPTDSSVLLNDENYGLLSIFEEQSVFNFKFNCEEEDYIERFKSIKLSEDY